MGLGGGIGSGGGRRWGRLRHRLGEGAGFGDRLGMVDDWGVKNMLLLVAAIENDGFD
jgi:hypothetical protein